MSEIPASEGIYFRDKRGKVYTLSEAPWPSFPPARIDYWISQLTDGHHKATKSKQLFSCTKKLWNTHNPKVKEDQLLEPILLRYGLKNTRAQDTTAVDALVQDALVQLSLFAFVKLILCYTIEDILCIIRDSFGNNIVSFLLCCEGASEGYKIPPAVNGHIIKIFQDHTHGQPEVFTAKCTAFVSELTHENPTNVEDNRSQRKRPRQDSSANIDGDTDDPHISDPIGDAQGQKTLRNSTFFAADEENLGLSSDKLATAVDLVLRREVGVPHSETPVPDTGEHELSSGNVAAFIINYDSKNNHPGGMLQYKRGEPMAVVKFPKQGPGTYGIEVIFGTADWQNCLLKNSKA